jgi:cytochrome c-type biogenesis protein CcmH
MAGRFRNLLVGPVVWSAILTFCVLGPLPVAAQPTSTGGAELELTVEQEGRAAALAAMLKCPVCKSQSLAGSHSFLAEEMKRQIRQKILNGESDDEILDYFVARYTEWILLKPRARGWQWLLYLVPAAGLLFAAGVALLKVKSDVDEAQQPRDVSAKTSDRASSLLQKEIEL